MRWYCSWDESAKEKDFQGPFLWLAPGMAPRLIEAFERWLKTL